LFEDPDFGQRYVDRWAQWQTNISPRRPAGAVTNWPLFQEPAARNLSAGRSDSGRAGALCGQNFEDEIQYLKSWITNRLSWMTAQFVARQRRRIPAERWPARMP